MVLNLTTSAEPVPVRAATASLQLSRAEGCPWCQWAGSWRIQADGILPWTMVHQGRNVLLDFSLKWSGVLGSEVPLGSQKGQFISAAGPVQDCLGQNQRSEVAACKGRCSVGDHPSFSHSFSKFPEHLCARHSARGEGTHVNEKPPRRSSPSA